MDIEKLYDVLDASDSLTNQEDLLLEYLVHQAQRYEEGVDPTSLAYQMSGLLGSRALAATDDNHPLKKVLIMASELELPGHHQPKTASWDRLLGMIAELQS